MNGFFQTVGPGVDYPVGDAIRVDEVL